MQQSDIVKLCAASLRDFLKREHAIEELKSSHAHELAAAFWGYKSKNALLADTKYPLENLPQARIMVLAPTAPIDERRAQLEGLPPFLPNNYILGAEMWAGLIAKKQWMLGKPWPTFEALAVSLADETLRQHMREEMHYKPTGEGVKVEHQGDSVLMTVTRFYQIPKGDGVSVDNRHMTLTITLPRVAGHVGYGQPETSIKITPPPLNEPANFQAAYAKKALEFWTMRPYARRTSEILSEKPYGIEAQFIYETDEILKDVCFDLTNRLHDYDNDVEVRAGQDLTHRVLYLCATPEDAEEIARLLGASAEIRVHKLY